MQQKYRDPTFLFLNHPVHGSGAVVDFADLMGLTGIEQDTFRGGRFTGINVCMMPIFLILSKGNSLPTDYSSL